MRRAAAAAAALAWALAGCGGTAGDLVAIEVSGGPVKGTEHIVVLEDGRARCNAGPLETIPSDRLLDAREVERDLEPLAEKGASYEAPAAGRRRYLARTRDGAVRWVEGARSVPSVIGKATLLALQLERQVCSGR
jgi:hypothetical protein